MYFEEALKALRDGKIVIYNEYLYYKLEGEVFYSCKVRAKNDEWERVSTFYANDLTGDDWEVLAVHNPNIGYVEHD